MPLLSLLNARSFKAWRRVATALLGLAAAWPLHAGEVRVAVAANFAAPMARLAQAFERETGHKALVSVASTGRLYAQVRNGAPFELFLSADEETAARLEEEGLAVRGSRWTYATGRLVLWSREPGRVDAEGAVLRRPQGRLALADPKLAPYGRAAQEVMAQLGLLEAWRPFLVQGESLAQAHQFVLSGNAPLGWVAQSQVFLDGRLLQGSAWLVPEHLHAPLRQDAVLLTRGQGQPAARALVAFLRSEPARALIRAHGYKD